MYNEIKDNKLQHIKDNEYEVLEHVKEENSEYEVI